MDVGRLTPFIVFSWPGTWRPGLLNARVACWERAARAQWLDPCSVCLQVQEPFQGNVQNLQALLCACPVNPSDHCLAFGSIVSNGDGTLAREGILNQSHE